MCCILDGILSDLALLLGQFSAYFLAHLGATYQFICDKLTCARPVASDEDHDHDQDHNQHERNPEKQQQRRSRRLQDFAGQQQHPGGRLVEALDGPAALGLEYRMMSKKGLLKFVKYTLIFSNAFGFILSIFLGLFGIAYPDKHFPLSYKGREMALCSLFCMFFTTIGYCGAQNHRRILLIIYGATNVIIVIIVVILWFLFRENSILGNKEISNMFITTLAITIAVMFLFAFILAFHIRTFKDDAQDSIVSQSHQLLQQTTAFLQQQQQAAAAAAAAAAATAAHLGGPPLMEGAFGAGMPSQQHGAAGQLHQQAQLPPPHHPMHQHLQHQQLMQHRQQDLVMLGHHHAQGRMLMGRQSPPAQAIQMAHIKSAGASTSASQRNKSLKTGAQLIMGPPSGHQMSLMRNQSSPLPVAGTSVQQMNPAGQQLVASYQTAGGGAAKGQQQQQLYSQSQKHPRACPPPEPPSPPPPPPPPQSVSQPGANHVPPQPPAPPSNQQAQQQHHHQHHQSLRQAGAARLPPVCPVQYCTFDCDRTV